MFKRLTKIAWDIDVVDTALASCVIMWVIWGQNCSFWSGEMASAGSCRDKQGKGKQGRCNVNNVQWLSYNTRGEKNYSHNSQVYWKQLMSQSKSKWKTLEISAVKNFKEL